MGNQNLKNSSIYNSFKKKMKYFSRNLMNHAWEHYAENHSKTKKLWDAS